MCSPLEMQFPVTNGCPDPANLCSCERSALVSRAAGHAGSSGADKHRSEALGCHAHRLGFLLGAYHDATFPDVSDV